jgi:alanyl-tRNA synthetase
MRRAMRHAHLLGSKDPVMHRLVPALVQQMGAAYPELGLGQTLIEDTLLNEEVRFKTTLDRGLKLLDDALVDVPEGSDLSGDTAFKLYDTFGFPLDLTQDALREQGRGVDTEGFKAAMDAQKAKARAAWTGTGASADAAIWFDIADKQGSTEFLGYETETAQGQLLAIVSDTDPVDVANKGDSVALIFNQTPFYGESGGQVGDEGTVKTDTGTARITDTKKVAGLFLHMAEITSGTITKGQGSELVVDHARRAAIRANHSATHLLNEALRVALGDHVVQRGSLNAADRLRFDFTHTGAMTSAELTHVEQDVNRYVQQNTAVSTRIMTPDDARALGAQAQFGEKYGDEVRVVSMGRAKTGKGVEGLTYSLELCGGTHVARTGDIGMFALTSERASSDGVRRIEALTGQTAMTYLRTRDETLGDVEGMLKAKGADVATRVKALMDERKSLANEVAQLRREVAMGGGARDEVPQAKTINGIAFKAQVMQGITGKDLPAMIDEMKSAMGSGAILLIADGDGKAAVAAGVTADLVDKVSAVDLVRAAVAELGGKGGGGRPDMAQGGGKDARNADAAIAAAEAILLA